MARQPKYMLIGLDSLSMEIIDRYANDGTAPTLKKMIRTGASGPALPEFPIYTPTNWAVLATGARPGTNAAGDWFNDLSGQTLSTFDSRAIQCETIQDAVGRQGLKSLSVMYPSAYPVRHKNCMALAPLQKGLMSNELYHGKVWDVKTARNTGTFAFITAAELGTEMTAAARAKAVGATEDGADLGVKRSRKVKAVDEMYTVVLKGRSFTILNGKRTIATGTVGVWSDFAILTVPTQEGRKKGSVRFKVFAPQKRMVRVAASGVYDVSVLVTPGRHLKRLLTEVGPVFEHAAFNKFLKIDSPTLKQDLKETVEELEYQVDWIIRAAAFMQKVEGWDVFYLHWHFPDNILHGFLGAADRVSPVNTPQRERDGRMVIKAALKLCDRLVKGLSKLAGPQTNMCVVSDHGNSPNLYGFSLDKRLIETGLTVLKKDGSVDLKRSRAVVGGWKYKVDVNRKAVKAADYDNVQTVIIEALHDWREPTTGKRVVAFAFKRKDAPVVGFYGPTAGDVTVFYNSGFAWGGYHGSGSSGPTKGGANHGPQMPTTFTEYTSNMAFFIITGPQVKRGTRITADDGFMRLVDIVPTMCHLAGMEPPRDCQGAVRYRVKRG